MRFYFVRHGESEANIANLFSNRPPGLPLTAAGEAQAQALATRLAGEGLTGIYSSPLLRAQQTASALAAPLGLTVQVTDALREYDMGIYEGTADPAGWAANRELFGAWLRRERWADAHPGGESLNDMRNRLDPFVTSLVAAHADTGARLALIGHGGLYLALLPLLLANVTPTWALNHPLGNTAMVEAEPRDGSLHCLSWCGLSPTAD